MGGGVKLSPGEKPAIIPVRKLDSRAAPSLLGRNGAIRSEHPKVIAEHANLSDVRLQAATFNAPYQVRRDTSRRPYVLISKSGTWRSSTIRSCTQRRTSSSSRIRYHSPSG